MKQCPILLYHWFRPAGQPSRSRAARFEIGADLFARQVELLRARGYRSVSLDAAANPKDLGPLPAKPIVLTFDDGSADFFQFARPILQQHGFGATVFVVTGLVGTGNRWDRASGEPHRPLMSWDQLRELHAAGFEIGSHTHSHRRLTGLSDDEVREELVRSRETLLDEIGLAPGHLAFPYGDFANRHKRIARAAGYRGACATVRRFRDLIGADPYSLRRMVIKGTESMFRFGLRLRLAGVIPLRGDVP